MKGSQEWTLMFDRPRNIHDTAKAFFELNELQPLDSPG